MTLIMFKTISTFSIIFLCLNNPTQCLPRLSLKELRERFKASNNTILIKPYYQSVDPNNSDSLNISDNSIDDTSDEEQLLITEPTETTTYENNESYGINSKICGLNRKSKIVNGYVSEQGQFPWMAALMATGSHKPVCGGSIISEKFIITAAHCLYGKKFIDYSIRLGAHEFNGQTETYSRLYEIDKWVIHEEYESHTDANDIAIIKLRSNIEYNPLVRPICLPPNDGQDYSGLNAKVAGWGLLEDEGIQSDVLRHVDIKVWPNSKCSQMYGSFRKISKQLLCTHSKNGTDSCQGDSGGPLMIKNKYKHWELVGVVSHGPPCAHHEIPSINTRVTQYIDWIEETIEDI